ncbi:MAG TPA: phage tail tape measure protein [Anaerolineales bacterium]
MSGAAITIGDAILRILGDDSGLDPTLASAEGKAKSWAGRLEGGISKLVGGAIVGGVAALTGAVVGIGAAAFAAGGQFDDAYDKIQTRTGATGSTLAQLQQDFKSTFTSVPTDAGTVSDAIAALNSRLGITGDSLTGIAKPLLEATRLMGGDAKTNADLFTRAMGDWNIAVDQAPGALDKFFAASQQGGVGMDSLMQKVVQFGSPMRLMGFTLEDSIALFAKWEKEGVNSELVMGSLRIAAGKFASDGKPLRESLLATFDSIQKNTDASAALADGMAIFGARAGPDMVAAIREGRFSIDDLVAAMGDSKGAILDAAAATADFPEKLNVMKNKAVAILAPLGLKMMGLVTTVADGLLTWFDSPAIQAGIDRFVSGAQRVLDRLMQFPAMLEEFTPLEAIGEIIKSFVPADVVPIIDQVVSAMQNLGQWVLTTGLPAFQQIAGAIWSQLGPGLAQLGVWIVDLATAALPLLQAAIQFVVDHWRVFAVIAGVVVAALVAINAPILFIVGLITLLATAWANNWGGIRSTLTGFWAVAQPLFQLLFTWLSTTLTGAITTLAGFWTGTLQPALQTVWNFLNTYIFPIFRELVDVYFLAWTRGLEALAGLWQNVLQPALSSVWSFLQTSVIPVFQNVADVIQKTLGPAITWLNESVFQPLSNTLTTSLKGALKWVYDTLVNMAGFLKTFKLPDWLTPGSPTPFEWGLRGIAGAMDELNKKELPELSARLGLLPAPGLTGNASRVTTNQFTQNIYTNAPSEPIVSDFGRLRARARG